MTHLLAQHLIGSVSGVPADVTVNTFHFSTAAPVATPADYDAAVTLVHEFFSTMTTAGAKVETLLGQHLDPASARVKVYDMTDPMPRVPRRDSPQPLGSTGAGFLPSECALVVSFRGLSESGVLARRNRGRIYLGPLAGAVGTFSAASGDVRPTLLAQQIAVAAALRLSTAALPAGANLIWSIYSKVDNALRPVGSGYVDNALDTQRRRGRLATSRVSWIG
jgi:hypothetical protein